MFDRFTDRSRKVMALARREAQRLNHDFIGTEHILLGLLQEDSGVAAEVLKSPGVANDTIRREIEKNVQPGPSTVTMGQLPFTPRAKQALLLSMEESNELGHDHIGTEHLLLGLIREPEGVAGRVLRGLGLEIEELRKEALKLLGTETPRRATAARGNGLELRDEGGQVRARLDLRPDGCPFLEMLDAAGRIRVHLGLDASGAPTLEFRGEDGKAVPPFPGSGPTTPPPAPDPQGAGGPAVG